MEWTNPSARQTPADAGFRYAPDRPARVLSAIMGYAPTPLTDVPELARELGLARVWVKDETARMGLGSFKALGGAFALAQMVLDKAGTDDPTAPEALDIARGMTFITASAGNHGLSVAAGAKATGAQAVVVLSATVPDAFADRIRATGARVHRVEGSYEDSIEEAIRLAEENGWVHLADGSWPGYTAAPALVMEGYSLLSEECRAEFEAGGAWPTHVYLQAGVGGLAAGVAAHIRGHWAVQPKIVVVEPDAAPCLMESVRSGTLTHAPGPVSNMGRLDCKDASLLAFDVLRDVADTFVTVSDAQASEAMARLAAAGIGSTPSGAAGFAALATAGLTGDARVMLIASEGGEDG